MLRQLGALEEPAQNGRAAKRATRRATEFLRCLVARIRALCALEELSWLMDQQSRGEFCTVVVTVDQELCLTYNHVCPLYGISRSC